MAGSAGEVAVRIRAAYALLNASPALGQARQHGAEAAEMFARSVDGTTHATAKVAAALLAAVPDLLDEVAAAIGQGNQAAHEYLSAIGADGGGSASAGLPVPDPDDRAGARIQAGVEDEDFASRAERFGRTAARRADDLGDTIADAVRVVQDGMAAKPTGQHTGHRQPDSQPQSQGPGAPDLVTGVAAGAALIAGAVQLGMRHWRNRRDRDDKDTQDDH